MRDDERCGRSKEVDTPELIGQRDRVRVTPFSPDLAPCDFRLFPKLRESGYDTRRRKRL